MYKILFGFILQSKTSQLGKLKSELETLGHQCKSLEESKGWLQRSLQETEVIIYCSIISMVIIIINEAVKAAPIYGILRS